MLKVGFIRVAAVILPLLIPTASAMACPTGGRDAAFEPQLSERQELLLTAAEIERSAAVEEQKAQSQRATAKRQRQLAVNLRERARLFPDVDGQVLFARARVADQEALAAESRAKTATRRAQALRLRAAEIRELAKQSVRDPFDPFAI